LNSLTLNQAVEMLVQALDAHTWMTSMNQMRIESQVLKNVRACIQCGRGKK